MKGSSRAKVGEAPRADEGKEQRQPPAQALTEPERARDYWRAPPQKPRRYVPTDTEFEDALIILARYIKALREKENRSFRGNVEIARHWLRVTEDNPRRAGYPLYMARSIGGGLAGNNWNEEEEVPRSELVKTAKEIFPEFNSYFPGFFDDTEAPVYTGDAPSPEADDASQLRMRDDFNTAIKQARTEVLARMLDLDNSALSEKERLTRARRVVRSFERRRAEDPNFPASREVRNAISIVNRHNYRNATARKAKAKLAM